MAGECPSCHVQFSTLLSVTVPEDVLLFCPNCGSSLSKEKPTVDAVAQPEAHVLGGTFCFACGGGVHARPQGAENHPLAATSAMTTNSNVRAGGLKRRRKGLGLKPARDSSSNTKNKLIPFKIPRPVCVPQAGPGADAGSGEEKHVELVPLYDGQLERFHGWFAERKADVLRGDAAVVRNMPVFLEELRRHSDPHQTGLASLIAEVEEALAEGQALQQRVQGPSVQPSKATGTGSSSSSSSSAPLGSTPSITDGTVTQLCGWWEEREPNVSRDPKDRADAVKFHESLRQILHRGRTEVRASVAGTPTGGGSAHVEGLRGFIAELETLEQRCAEVLGVVAVVEL